ncbi:MAG: hypothetical protein ACK2UI_08605 [Anaerolineae bacterium]|jgi:hypothetical protein
MKTLSEIRPVKRSREAELLEIPGVTGVDIGYKVTEGEQTGELSIRVYVAEKKPLEDIPKSERIPKTTHGIKTDVIQRKYELHPLMMKVADMVLHSDTGNYDPLQGGISIGPCRTIHLDAATAACHGAPGAGWYQFVGTLGAIVRDNATNDPMLLSNFHVMCVDNGWTVGDTMAQPSRVDGGTCPTHVVGALQRASLGGQVDCAVASHTARGYQCSIVDIGDVIGTAAASVGMAVRKRGRTTGLTYGIVDSVDLTVNINYCNGLGTVTLTNQIGIHVDEEQSPQFGISGDSGSAVVNANKQVVGLYFAGTSDGQHGAANPIQAVLSALNVSMCTRLKKREPDFKKREPDMVKKREPDVVKKREPDVVKKREPDYKKREPDTVKKQEPDFEQPTPEYYDPNQPVSDVGRLEARLAQLEDAVAQLAHFISPEQRPDVDAAPLQYESDTGEY